jgi:hypothetical protein
MESDVKNQSKKRAKVRHVVRGGAIGFFIGLFLSSCLISVVGPLNLFVLNSSQDLYGLSAIVQTSIICSVITGIVVAIESDQ